MAPRDAVTDVETLRALLAAASPLPWKKWTTATTDRTTFINSADGLQSVAAMRACEPTMRAADAALTLAAVNGLSALLDELERLRADLARLRAAVADADMLAAVVGDAEGNLTADPVGTGAWHRLLEEARGQ